MRSTTRMLWAAVLGGSLLVGSSWFAAASASGGGGCGKPVSDARGTRVTIKQFCFSPTVLHVRRGTTVTFTNLDPFPHNVQGASVSWGSWDQVRFGKPVRYRFVRSGVYPYVCSFHPGMVGAIVVGSGNGRGSAGTTTTENGPVIRVRPVRAELVSASVATGGDGIPVPLAAFIAFGLVAVAAVALMQLRQQYRE
jgi:plastocyanin